MPLDADRASEAGTPEWWLVRLGTQLTSEAGQLDTLNAYDQGEHPLPIGHSRARAAYQRFQTQSRTNFTGLVVDAVMDRLKVGGFRMDSSEADDMAQMIWQANGMDAGIRLAFRDALVMRRSYVIVGPDEDNESGVLLTTEDPRQVTHSLDPRNRRRVQAALKVWDDDNDGHRHAVLYLPSDVVYFVGTSRAGQSDGGMDEASWNPMQWNVDTNEGTGGIAPNPTAPLIPVVPFINRPEKKRIGFGECEDILSIQDRINQGTLDRLTTGAAQSFRQRWATGVEFKDQDGNATQPFDPGVDLMWHVSDPAAEFGDFEATDIRPLIEGVSTDVEQLASISRTPPYYLLGKMVNISGDALTAADSGATSKAEARQEQFGEALEAVMALGFKLLGKTAPVDAETIWAEAERRNQAASADAAVKKSSVGVPWAQLMEDLGYSPAQIARMEIERAKDQIRAVAEAGLLAAAAAAPPPAETAALETNGNTPKLSDVGNSS
ncbi:MAG: phage portal protein [bacterium]|nr:phage portal protein [bacterium]